MFNEYDDFPIVKGVILSHKTMGENNLLVTLFLEDAGIMTLSSKDFKGDSEPFVWGDFYLRRKKKGSGYFIFDTDIKDCMLHIRRGRESIEAAFNFSSLLIKYLPAGHSDDELLTNLYWSMKLLSVSSVPSSAVYWRFIWKWLEEWGLAPDLISFYAEKGFNDDEVSLLSQLSILNVKEIAELFNKPISANIREHVFKVASKLAQHFFIEQ